MAVRYRQLLDGEAVDAPQKIERHHPRQSDVALLRAKAQGATNAGWEVTWTDKRAFSAVKVRWGGVLCTRQFWIE